MIFNWCKIISDQEKHPCIVLSEEINVKHLFKISKYLGIKCQPIAKIHNIMIPANCVSQPYKN